MRIRRRSPGVVNIPANGSDNQLGIFVRPWQVAKFFRQNKFDVIHIHEPAQPSLSYWSVWMTRKIPHVATFHAYAEDESRAFTFARRLWGCTMFPFFQRAIAVSAGRRALRVDGVEAAARGHPERRADEHLHARADEAPRLGDGRAGAPAVRRPDRRRPQGRALPVRRVSHAARSRRQRHARRRRRARPGRAAAGAPGPALSRRRSTSIASSSCIASATCSSRRRPARSRSASCCSRRCRPRSRSCAPTSTAIARSRFPTARTSCRRATPPRSPIRSRAVAKLDPSTRRRQGEINRKAALGYDWDRARRPRA